MFDAKVVLTLLCVATFGCYAADPEVQTSLGKIQGSLMSTLLNKTIYAFRGVRYAKAPEGDLRFKNPVAVDSWTDTYDATQEGPACPTIDTTATNISEDCLVLNVYTTKLPTDTDTVNRTVIVFFHPGAFLFFSGQSSVYGPEYYLDKDIVLVTVNYRLGTLGFISTGDERAPGNLGLKDQVVALKWVQQNIAAFGGNPNSVTITGCSAGAWSVILHMMSPMSVGLFHRGIAMSGSPTVPDNFPTNQTNLVLKQATYVNCPNDTLDNAFECLKTVPFKNLSDSLVNFYEWYGDPSLIWSPVVEPEITGVERFITDQPVNLIRKKEFQQIPIIIGITHDDYASAGIIAYEQAIAGDDTIYRNLTDNWEFAAPISFQYERGTERSKNISQQIKNFYFNGQEISSSNGLNLGLIYSDALIGFPTHRAAQLLAQYSSAPVYHYQFAYQGRFSYVYWGSGDKEGQPFGVGHQDDTQYLFYLKNSGFPFFNATDPEVTMVDKLTTMWTNFAETGEPIPTGNDLFKNVTWTALDASQQNYLVINETLTMQTKMYPDRYALWDELFPLPSL